MAALAATLMWQWARAITGSTSAATFGWASAALTAPFLFNSFTVYPEIPAALAVMVALAWRPGSTMPGVMLARGVAIGALPWLSTKYAPMAGAVTVGTADKEPVEFTVDRCVSHAGRARVRWLVRILLLDLGHGFAVGTLRIVGDDDPGSPGARDAGPALRSGIRRRCLRPHPGARVRRSGSDASLR